MTAGDDGPEPALTHERWRAVKRVLPDALALPPADRPAFLDRACAGDAALRREVESLLAADDADDNAADALDRPAAAAFGGDWNADAALGPRPPELAPRVAAALADRYAVECEVGRGGTATVYRARDLRLGRPVALKVLRAELGVMLGGTRFRREVLLAARLQHPHIVPVLDSGEAAGRPWFAMPYVEGESLRRRLEREGRLPVADAVAVAREVASALDYVHRHGVVHRDVKPENILLSDGHALVADFGIAKAIDAALDEAHAAARGHTGTGFVVGTPAYMSPEQAAGARDLDARTDVYALGLVLYEMLAGAPAFAGSTPHALYAQRLSGTRPQVAEARPDVPPALAAAVDRALQAAPADRYPTAAAFAEALGAAGQTAPVPTAAGAQAGARAAGPRVPRLPRAQRVPRARRAAAGVGAALALAAGALVLWSGGPRGTADAGAMGRDPDAVAVLPFRHDGADAGPALSGDDCARLLTDGLARWQNLRLSDDMRVADAARARGRDALTVDGARRLARSVGASRFVWGETAEEHGVLRVSARLYDGRSARPATYTARLAPGGDATAAFGALADSLVAELAAAPAAAVAPSGTRNFEALTHYTGGYAALHRWDMPAAERHFRAAAELDPGYVQASFALAQTLAWSPDRPPSAWREPAARAVADSARLGVRDRALATALLALADGRMGDACAVYRGLLARSPRDFAAQYGLGECLSRDRLVVRDPSDPRRWRFRSSLAEAAAAYTRALELVPGYFGAARGDAFAALARRAFYTAPTAFRLGYALAPDTVWMGAFPELVGDTVTFRPATVAAMFAADEPPSHPAAVAHEREALRALAVRWVDAYPQSTLAWLRYGEALEALGLLDDPAPGAGSALRATGQARRLAATDATLGVRDAVATAAVQTRVLLKLGRFDQARAVAESALSDTVRITAMPDSGRAAEALAALAALTGRARLTARLLTRAAVEPENTVFRNAPGTPLPPAPVLRAAAAFAAYAALAAPAESVRATRARTEREVAAWVPPAARVGARGAVLVYSGLLGQPVLGTAALRGMRGGAFGQVGLWQALDRGDSAAVRRGLAARPRDVVRDVAPAPEWLLQRAHLALAVRDTATAKAALAELFATLPREPSRLTGEVGVTAAIGRALALRARLAPADSIAARDARALWSHADPELRPGGPPPRGAPG